jgi:hypothetical protein
MIDNFHLGYIDDAHTLRRSSSKGKPSIHEYYTIAKENTRGSTTLALYNVAGKKEVAIILHILLMLLIPHILLVLLHIKQIDAEILRSLIHAFTAGALLVPHVLLDRCGIHFRRHVHVCAKHLGRIQCRNCVHVKERGLAKGAFATDLSIHG